MPIDDITTFTRTFDSISSNVRSVVRGKDDVVRLALVALLSEGHILFEDVPGTGKSVLARALAQSISATWNRVQCTPDMLPGDITGSSIYDQSRASFEFRAGPVFANILLADEVNRATPKTQSALLEAMAERQVSSDGVTRPLPRPFIVLATQNPLEQAGTFPLPEAQLDRFLFKLSMEYMERADEIAVMLENSRQLRIETLEPVIGIEGVRELIDFATRIDIAPEVAGYVVDLVRASRHDPAVSLGGSPRASIALLRAARVFAASDGRTHVIPDDVRAVLKPVLAHRLILSPEAFLRGDTVDGVLDRITTSVKAPVAAARELAASG